MAKIIIKKRVNLGFLGDEHKEDYLVFKSIPVNGYKKIATDRPGEDESQYEYLVKILQAQFLEGSFQGEAVTKENIGDFDADAVITCFQRLSGQDPDPKV